LLCGYDGDIDLVKTQDSDVPSKPGAAEAIAEGCASPPYSDGPPPVTIESGQSPSKQEDFGVRWIINQGRSIAAPSLGRAVVLFGVLLGALYAVAIWIIYKAV
jgi:hypothetical protein